MTEQKIKKDFWAILLSLIFPGLGQIRSGFIVKGIVLIVVNNGLGAIRVWNIVDPNSQHPISYLNLIIGAVYIYNLIDIIYCVFTHKSGPQKISLKILIAAYLLLMSFGIVVALFLRAHYIQPFKAKNTAMVPALQMGDHFLIDKQIYKSSLPQRGDIVLFIDPSDKKMSLVRRIVGLPNETIEIKVGVVLINGAPLDQSGVFKNIHYYNEGHYGSQGKVVIPKDCYFILGDNNASSYDSRNFGFVSKNDIIGKAYKIYAPEERYGLLTN